MSFKVYKSNFPEILSEQFLHNIYLAGGRPVFAPYTVVVQTRGMAEYLKQYLADNSPIAGNLSMPFLNSFINDLLRAAFPEEYPAVQMRSQPEFMRWRILSILSRPDADRNYPELSYYLTEPGLELKRWQLSGKIADLFDQYQHYRFDRMDELFANVRPQERWQGRLYAELFPKDAPGPDEYFRRFLQLETFNIPEHYQQISVFGVGSLPPVYLKIFFKLADFCDVDFFYLTPCKEQWSYQYSRAEAKRRLAPWEAPEPGNPILQALGASGREFFTALMLSDDRPMEEVEDFCDFAETSGDGPDDYVPGQSALKIMQQDIFRMFDRRQLPPDAPAAEFTGQPAAIAPEDDSIRIHNCHSIRRELEVLQDEIISILQDGKIQPRDIIVMAPDITVCYPAIQAVFGTGPLQDLYSVADVPESGTAMILEAFQRLWQAAAGRFEYSEIMALLDLPVISAKLGLQEGDLGKLSSWLQEADVRWGLNGDMREHFVDCNFDEFSFEQAIHRLLLGYAARTGTDAEALQQCLQTGVAALDKVHFQDLELLGNFCSFISRLADLTRLSARRLPLTDWCRHFEKMLTDFFVNDNENRTNLAALRSAIYSLSQAARANDIPGDYPLNAVAAMLDDMVNITTECGGFLRGKITFCRMMPMRSIPMKAVAILNMQEGNFPRRDTRLGFDLAAVAPLPGDRSQTAQDRYLLLEAIMAAREKLWFFYQGRNTLDNRETPPCAPLNEIAAYLAGAFGITEIKHKLSGIDVAYFDGRYPQSPMRSFDRSNLEALRAILSADKSDPARPMPEKLNGIPHLDQTVDLRELVSYFTNPAQWLLEHQLNMRLKEEENSIQPEDEPIKLESLTNYKLDNILVSGQINPDDISSEDLYYQAQRMNLLPPGRNGKRNFDARQTAAAGLPEQWRYYLQNIRTEYVICDLPELGWNIAGEIRLAPDQNTVLSYRCGKYDARTALPAVLGSLICTLARNQATGAAMLNLNGNNFESRCLAPVTPEAALEQLKELLEIAGSSHTVPPPFFLRSSVLYDNLKDAAKAFYTCNFHTKSEYGDYFAPGVKEYFPLKSFDDAQFAEKFQYYGRLLYKNITIQGVTND